LELYCRRLGLDHPALTEFCEHLWRLPLGFRSPDAFQVWYDATPGICLGPDDEPDRAALLAFAYDRGVPPAELSALLDSVAEVVYDSFYGAADDAASLRCLERALTIAAARGVTPPPASLVATSRLADRHGWGELPDGETIARWRDGPGDA
jgi:hypothetical protein